MKLPPLSLAEGSQPNRFGPALNRLENNTNAPRPHQRAGRKRPTDAAASNQPNRRPAIQCAIHIIKTPFTTKCSAVFTRYLTLFRHTEFISHGTFLALVPLN
jgi:hypothetical protein